MPRGTLTPKGKGTGMLVLLLVYIAIGLWLTLSTASRGFIADFLFTALWPVYIWVDWRAGRL